jgi:hypothetical protein
MLTLTLSYMLEVLYSIDSLQLSREPNLLRFCLMGVSVEQWDTTRLSKDQIIM